MDQTRLESLIETVVNTLIGFIVAFFSQMLVFPLVGLENVPIATNLEIGAWFTAISVLRGYVIRRWFNARLKKVARLLACGHKVT